ncbi:hypothetical protein [Nonomuraea sp. B5E05]|uniref:hypothetical protein n=1 Tax=Nonomuraea sp. B5E05 TaxID=3153569 RepID=UPI00326040B6
MTTSNVPLRDASPSPVAEALQPHLPRLPASADFVPVHFVQFPRLAGVRVTGVSTLTSPGALTVNAAFSAPLV